MELKGVIHGPINAEDLAAVPGTPWIVTSGMRGPTAPQANLYLIDRRDGAASELYPYRVGVDHDTATYGSELTALDPAEFDPHGVDVGPDPQGRLCVYVVHHGVRESVEIFRIDLDGRRPSLTWVGAVALPSGCWGNDVAVLPDGGFLVTSTTDISDGLEAGFGRSLAGEPTGKVVEWSPVDGWRDLPGSQMNSTNGVAVSPDGTQVFIAGWRPRTLVRVSRGAGDPQVDTIDVDLMPDNLTWTSDGHLLAAGPADTTVEQFTAQFYGSDPECRFPTKVIKVHPDTLEVTTPIDYAAEVFGPGTTALEVDDEIWIGSMRFEGVGRFG